MNIKDKKYLKAFGARLQRLRQDRHMSREVLGLECGLGKFTVGLMEDGEFNPSITTLRALAGGLKVSVLVLMDFDEK